VGRKGQGLKRGQIHKIFKKVCQEAGIPKEKSHFHVLKHSLAIYILEQTGDIRLVQDVLGHKDIKSSAIYARYIDKKRDEKYLQVFYPKF
jgi:site-specific recombinase XerD